MNVFGKKNEEAKKDKGIHQPWHVSMVPVTKRHPHGFDLAPIRDSVRRGVRRAQDFINALTKR